MTLNEYINQPAPQAQVTVILKAEEYILRDTVKVTPYCFHTAVDIPAIAHRYNIDSSYIWVGTCRQLFTRNPQTGELHGSVFFLPDDTPEPAHVTQFLQFLTQTIEFLSQWRADNPYQIDGLQGHNARFKTAYSEFLNSIKDTYALTDEDIDYWLTRA